MSRAYRIIKDGWHGQLDAPNAFRVLGPIQAANGGGRYAVREEADALAEYELYSAAGWDGDDALPITPETITAARAFNRLLPHKLRRPDTAPGADGTIGFEWREGPPDQRRLILIDVGPGDRVSARIVHEDGRVESLTRTQVGTGAKALIEALFP